MSSVRTLEAVYRTCQHRRKIETDGERERVKWIRVDDKKNTTAFFLSTIPLWVGCDIKLNLRRLLLIRNQSFPSPRFVSIYMYCKTEIGYAGDSWNVIENPEWNTNQEPNIGKSMKIMYVLTPHRGEDVTQGQFLGWVLQILIQSFLSSRLLPS